MFHVHRVASKGLLISGEICKNTDTHTARYVTNGVDENAKTLGRSASNVMKPLLAKRELKKGDGQNSESKRIRLQVVRRGAPMEVTAAARTSRRVVCVTGIAMVAKRARLMGITAVHSKVQLERPRRRIKFDTGIVIAAKRANTMGTTTVRPWIRLEEFEEPHWFSLCEACFQLFFLLQSLSVSLCIFSV